MAMFKGGKERKMLKRVVLATVIAAFAAGTAMAQETCDSKAVGKDGKPLAGAADVVHEEVHGRPMRHQSG